jgi:phytoene synthase
MAMCAVYAYLRELDDLADGDFAIDEGVAGVERRSEPPVDFIADGPLSLFADLDFKIENLTPDQQLRLARLQAAYDQFQKAVSGELNGKILPALADAIQKFSSPPEYFIEVMRGMAMDIQGCEYATWDELQKYCYRVASVVGLICLHIWGVRDERAKEPAIACGYAFQLTNILRDIGEDVRSGRIYLPNEDLQANGYSRDAICERQNTDSFRRLIQYEVNRARSFFDQAAALQRYLPFDAVRMFAAMFRTYRELLDKIELNADQLFSRRMRVSRWRKAAIAGRALILGGKSI